MDDRNIMTNYQYKFYERLIFICQTRGGKLLSDRYINATSKVLVEMWM